MKALVLTAVLALVAATRLLAPGPKVSPIFTLSGVRIGAAAATRDGRLIYYAVDSSVIRVYDRSTRRHSTVFEGRANTLDVSSDSRTLLFEAPGEDGGKTFIWTKALDPATGAAAGPARRVSMISGEDPAFSSDGRLVAFAAHAKTPDEQLVVVPANGGPERVLVRTKGAFSIWPIRWTPDDQWISYGASETKPEGRNAIYRIRVRGGEPEFVTPTADWGAYPGLSPDGRTILTWDVSWDTIVVATGTGERIAAYIAGTGEAPDSWIDGTKALSVSNLQPSVLQIRTLPEGAPRTLSDTNSIYLDPVWSPDGTRIATTLFSQNGIMLFDEAGTAKLIRTMSRVARFDGVHWSPDGSMLAYRPLHLGLRLVDPTTGTERELAPNASQAAVRWTTSGRSLIYAEMDAKAAPDSSRGLTMHEVSTSGIDRVLRTVRAGCPRCTGFLDDSTMVVMDPDLRYIVIDLHGRRPDRVLLRRTAPGGQAIPTVSRNGKWFAARQVDAAGEQRIIDLIAADGTRRRTLTLPFRTAAGHLNPWISDDGKELVVASQSSPQDDVTFYRVDGVTGTPTKLFTTPRQGAQYFASVLGSLAPDGRTVAYTTPLANRATVYELDYSEMLATAPGGRGR